MAAPFAGAALLAALRGAGGLRGALLSGGIGAAASSISSMLNPEESWAGKTGAVLGSGLALPGAVGGALAGGMLAGPKYRRYGGLAGGIAGAALGSGIGSSALGAAANQIFREEDPLVTAANSQLEIARRQLPLQREQAQMALQIESERAENMARIQNQLMRQNAAAQMMLNGQQNTANVTQQFLQMFGGGIGV